MADSVMNRRVFFPRVFQFPFQSEALNSQCWKLQQLRQRGVSHELCKSGGGFHFSNFYLDNRVVDFQTLFALTFRGPGKRAVRTYLSDDVRREGRLHGEPIGKY